MEYAELMKTLEEYLGLEGFEPDEDGQYNLMIDDSIVSFVNVPQKGLLDIVTPLCDIPSEKGKQLYRVLLSAMMPGNAAENYSFFIASEKKALYMRRSMVLSSLNEDSFRQILEKFVNDRDEWQSTINDFNQILPDLQEALSQQLEENRQIGMTSDNLLRI